MKKFFNKMIGEFPFKFAFTSILVALVILAPNFINQNNIERCFYSNYLLENNIIVKNIPVVIELDDTENIYIYSKAKNFRSVRKAITKYRKAIPNFRKAITKWWKSLKKNLHRAKILLFFSYLLKVIIQVLLKLINFVPFVLITLWLYIFNFLRSTWEEIFINIDFIIPDQGETIKLKNSYKYNGILIKFPRRVYKEESCVIKFFLQKEFNSKYVNKSIAKDMSESNILKKIQKMFKPKIEYSSLYKKVKLERKIDYVLELDLSSPEFIVHPSKMQSQPLLLEELSYRWNCKFQNSGKHVLDLVFTLVDKYNLDKSIKIIEVEREVRVVQFFGLTENQAESMKKCIFFMTTITSAFALFRGLFP